MPYSTVRKLVQERTETINNISAEKSKLETINSAILDELKGGDLYKTSGKESGETTVTLDGDIKVKLEVPKTVKADNAQMLLAGNDLSWEELNKYFKVKFEMTETQYGQLEAAAGESEKLSGVLDKVKAARTITIGALKLSSITIGE